MLEPPQQPKIYHITHVDNLPAIIAAGGLVSDITMIGRGGPSTTIGMSSIKQRRLTLPVNCHGGSCVGDYVPFYFCSRSVMLYLISMANHPDLTYRGGQEPIVHLEADMNAVIEWANKQKRRWAFSLSNAGARYTEFRKTLDDLKEIDWTAVAARDFRPSDVRHRKQAEFLVHQSFPWELVERVGVHSMTIGRKASATVNAARHRPTVEIMSDWYF